MGFFGAGKKRVVRERWKYVARSSIWRIIISNEGYFVCEDRDKDKKSVSFFCVEQLTGKVLWKDFRFDEGWWVGIEAVYKGYVFFHEFATPDMPDHKKIHACNLKTGETLWHNPEAKYLFAANDSVYTSRDLFERRIFQELDITTGEFRKEVDAQAVNMLLDSFAEQTVLAKFPEIVNLAYTPNDELKKAIEKAIAKSKNIVMIEYVENNDVYIIGFYDNIASNPEQPKLEQYLAVIDSRNAEIVYNEKIASEIHAPIPDTFFCKDNAIYVVKDKKVLTALEI